MYLEGFRHYMSDWELWEDHTSFGTLDGKLSEGEIVSHTDAEGKLLAVGLVTQVCEVDIENMISEHVIAGIDYPIVLPDSEN